jgi:hypothetical protein
VRNIGPDELFNLLPQNIRNLDPNQAIASFFYALAQQHNFIANLQRNLPLLIDPTQAAQWTPAGEGESATDWAAYLALVQSGEQQTAYGQYLAAKLPNSIAAWQLENQIIQLLGNEMGNTIYSQHLAVASRILIQTAVYRYQIKGTQSSIYILGRILGFIDLKAQELWSRFSLNDPSNPGNPSNNDDFAVTPDQYPYWPLNGQYGATDLDATYARYSGLPTGTTNPETTETNQLPLPTVGYNPTILDDGGQYTIIFPTVTGDPTLPTWYPTVINLHNPFGMFSAPAFVNGTTNAALVTGTYGCQGGTFTTAATASILDVNGLTVTFTCRAVGQYGNEVTISVLPDANGTRQIQLVGPQSKIKYKSSYFDLTTAFDPSVYSTLYTPIPVLPNPGGSDIDPTIGTQVTLNIADASTVVRGEPVNFFDLTMVESSAPPPINTVALISGLPGLNGLRTVTSIASLTGAPISVVVTDAPDGIIQYSDVNFPSPPTYPTFQTGRLAGDYPITGSVNGVQSISNPATNYQIDYTAFYEILATLTDMFSKIRPITRTQRLNNSGFLLQDQVIYAPANAINTVVLVSQSGQQWQLSILLNAPVWSPVTGQTPSDPILQDDRTLNASYQWTISNAGTFIPLLITSFGDQTLGIIYIYASDASANGFVYLDNGALQVSTSTPEDVVDQLHIVVGDPNETGLQAEMVEYAENPAPAIQSYMSADATTSVTPPQSFIFESYPEDDLTIQPLFTDGLNTGIADQWCERSGGSWPVVQTPDSSWNYNESGAFVGRDIRNRMTGSLPTLIEPMPSGGSFDGSGLDGQFPISFLDGYNAIVWRDRRYNQVMLSQYTAESTDPDTGPTRVDSVIDSSNLPPNDTRPPYENLVATDGRGEAGPSFSAQGFGPTSNNQSGQPEIDPWYPQYSNLDGINLSAGFSGVTNLGGGQIQFTLNGVTSSQVGARFRIDSGTYMGDYVVNGYGTGFVNATGTYSESSPGTIWWGAAWMQIWPDVGLGDQFLLYIEVLSGASVQYRFAEVAQDGSTTRSSPVTVLLNNSVTIQYNATGNNYAHVRVELSGSGVVALTFSRPTAACPIWVDPIATSASLWGSGERESMELTILGGGSNAYASASPHFYTYGEGGVNPLTPFNTLTTPPPNWAGPDIYTNIPYQPVNGVVTVDWMGGSWKGADTATYTDRSEYELPDILVHDDGLFPPA